MTLLTHTAHSEVTIQIADLQYFYKGSQWITTNRSTLDH